MNESKSLKKAIKTENKPLFCPGCGHLMTLGALGQIFDELNISQKTIFMVDIGCSLLAWNFFNVATTQTHHGRTVPTAVGFKMADPGKIVMAYVGDGGAYAIGLQHTISACLRNDPITTIVINNTIYAMTGGQMAPTTTTNQKTTTTPGGFTEKTMKGPETLKSLGNTQAYLARASAHHPQILKEFLKKAIDHQLQGNFSLVEVLSPCPTNWRTKPEETMVKMKELENEFPLGEF